MYYNEKVSPAVMAERGTRKLSRSENLALIKKVTLETWAAETAKVKELVRQKMKEQNVQGKNDDDGSGSETAECAPENFQK
jgi:hypothetical protein